VGLDHLDRIVKTSRYAWGVFFLLFVCSGGLMSGNDQEKTPDTFVNRLADASSPYLLQHRHNPVDWYAWGPEAFDKAKKENKPVFLSIGYSTCHWCHVMAHESFEDHEVARLMNDAFVSIKVDREERPDIDGIYMSVCQMMTGQGGWPLTILMTPDQKPFFAATYIPKTSRFGRTGMLELVPRIKEIWETQRDKIDQSAERIVQVLNDSNAGGGKKTLDPELLDRAFQQFEERFDGQRGGFGQAPKFPTPHNLLFLLRYAARTNNADALGMVEKTARAMRLGGIYDHLGFGFHRYSTDAEWRVPHFEKMLYDQAQLATVYLETYQVTGKDFYRRTAEEVFRYVLRDMTSPEGGFYSAEDADSEGEEGKFYLWSEEEIRACLEKEEADLITDLFQVESRGNFLEEATQEKIGTNILFLNRTLEEAAQEMEISAEALWERVENARQRLFDVREKRIHPGKDDKILTAWNGLMISAFARGAFILQEPRYVEAARNAADFVLRELRTSDGRLLHRYRNGQAGIAAHLEDYAFLVAGLIDLYQATFEVNYLKAAVDLNREMIRHFHDDENGGFYFTADDGEELIVRRKEADDGAVPSGNSMAMYNLLRLGRMLGDAELEALAERTGNAFVNWISRAPYAFTQFMVALDLASSSSQELVITGRLHAPDTQALLKALAGRFLPYLAILFRPANETEPLIGRFADFTRSMTTINGKATAYVCSGYQCEQPVSEPAEMLSMLDGGR